MTALNLLPLLRILADGRFHSGEQIGQELGISRAAVWKQIRSLRALGVSVESVTGRGYRLSEPMSLLDRDVLLSGMVVAAPLLERTFDLHFSIDSTNAEAMRCIQDGAQRRLVIAEHQTGGRGRRGRRWVSPLGHNIYLSLVWPFERGVAALEGLSLVCGLAVASAVEQSGVTGVQLKWPNDVLLQGRKLAGILLEVQGDVDGACRVVIGVGVNTRIPEQHAAQIDQPFTDLATGGGGAVDRNAFAAALVDALVESVQRFESHGFGVFREQWMQRDRFLGQEVEVCAGSSPAVAGVARGVDVSGRLQIELPSGELRTVAGGEVFPSVRPAGALNVITLNDS